MSYKWRSLFWKHTRVVSTIRRRRVLSRKLSRVVCLVRCATHPVLLYVGWWRWAGPCEGEKKGWLRGWLSSVFKMFVVTCSFIYHLKKNFIILSRHFCGQMQWLQFKSNPIADTGNQRGYSLHTQNTSHARGTELIVGSCSTTQNWKYSKGLLFVLKYLFVYLNHKKKKVSYGCIY